MENQVQILEDLLARVQRNRLTMDAVSQQHGKWAARVGGSAPATAESLDEAGIPDSGGSDVIDLVNPTSVPPAASEFADNERPTRQSEANASNVEDEIKGEDDFSSVAPVSVSPVSAADTGAQTEDDFSSVAPVSTAPVGPAETADEDVAAELPPSMAPMDVTAKSDEIFSSAPSQPAAETFSSTPAAGVEDEPDTLDVVPPSMLPVSEPQMASDSASSVDEDELELVNTDTASMHPGIPQGTPSLEAEHAVQTADTASPAATAPPAIEARTFESTATATGDIVQISEKLPKPKSWTVSAVLHRAWSLGKSE